MFNRFIASPLAFFVLISCLTRNIASQSKPLLSSSVDNASRVTIPGSRHPLAQPQFDAGTVDPGMQLERMLLVLSPSQKQQEALQTFLDSQHDPRSSNYHHWLTPDEFGAKFGPAAQDIGTIKSWLAQQGFTVTSVARGGRWIEFSGASGQVERVFQTLMRNYNVGGRIHIANATDISVPAALSPMLNGILTLHDFRKHTMISSRGLLRPDSDGTYSSISPAVTSSSGLHALSAGDFAAIYSAAPLYQGGTTGTGQTIAIVARSAIRVDDVASFRSAFALPANAPIVTFNGPGFTTDPGDLDIVEATLDTEWSGAVAPAATINLVVSQSTATTDGVDLSSAYIVDNDLAPIMSVSFGACEADLGPAENAFYAALWQQAAAQGISVFVASGDSGAAGCDFPEGTTPASHGLAVSGLASTPFNTAVGGTQFNEGANSATFWSSSNLGGLVSAKGYVPEAVWNETCDPRTATCADQLFALAGSGGGSSSLYAKPGWQLAGIPGTGNSTARDLPDVSLTAAAGHDPYLICFSGSCDSGTFGGIGGTSASAPAFAGIMALVDQATGSRQGLPNYMLYRLAAAENFSGCDSSARLNPVVASSCVFNDVTAGNNSVPGQAGFSGGLGFDLATGLGSVNAANLVNAWKALALRPTITTLAPASITAVHGQPVSFTVTVSGPAAPSPGGMVSFRTDKVGPVSSEGPLIEDLAGPAAVFSGNIAELPGGSYNLIAHYPGDALNAPSDSAAIAVSVTPESSVLTLDAFAPDATGVFVSTRSFPYASLWVLHASVKGASGKGLATGIVSFQEITQPALFVPSSVLNLKSEAELMLPSFNTQLLPFSVGTHTITASWPGDLSFNAASAQTPLSITVTKGNPGVGFLPFPAITATQPAQVFASVGINLLGIPVVPTGTVQLFDGTTLMESVTLPQNGSHALFHPVFTSTGTHNLTAAYSGDSIYNPATSAVQAVAVLASFGFFGTTAVNVPAGQTATFNLTASGISPGPVTLSCSGAPAGSTCTVNPSSLSVNGNLVPFSVIVTTSASSQASPFPFRQAPIAFAGVLAILLAGHKRVRKLAPVVFLAGFLVLSAVSCGGGGNTVTPPPPPPVRTPTIATLTLTATSGEQSTQTSLLLTITH